jgi:hypothetical protein
VFQTDKIRKEPPYFILYLKLSIENIMMFKETALKPAREKH